MAKMKKYFFIFFVVFCSLFAKAIFIFVPSFFLFVYYYIKLIMQIFLVAIIAAKMIKDVERLMLHEKRINLYFKYSE